MTSAGSPTNASFTAVAYLESSNQRSESFNDGDNVVILGTVRPQIADIGKAADLFVVIQEQTSSTRLSYSDLDGKSIAWNGGLKTLQPAVETSSLKSSESIGIFAVTLETGTYKIFMGYMLIEGGPLHFNGKTYRITVD